MVTFTVYVIEIIVNFKCVILNVFIGDYLKKNTNPYCILCECCENEKNDVQTWCNTEHSKLGLVLITLVKKKH